MWNIIKSQLYQSTRDIFMICVLFGLGGIYAILIYNGLDVDAGFNGGTAYASSGEWFAAIFFYMAVMIPARICGWDFNDKTINYELLAGHKKSEIFFARAFLSFAIMLLCGILMLGIPILTGCICGGWGVNLSAKAALIRIALTALVMVRFAAEMTCASFLLKNAYAAMLLGWIAPEIIAIIPLLTNNKHLYFLSSMMCLLEVSSFENARSGFSDGKDIIIYIADVEPYFAISIVISSIAITIACLMAGYTHFNRHDMK